MTTTELAHRTTSQVDPAEAARMSKSKLVPEHIADDPASAEYMMRIGEALGIAPVSAFQHIFVFPDGKGRLKAGMSAHLMQALAIAAGHEVHIEGNAVQATAVLVRHTSPEKLSRFQAMREEERRSKLSVLEDTKRLYELERDQIRDRIADLQTLVELGGDAEDIQGEIKSLRKQLLDLSKKYDFDELRKNLLDTKFDLSRLTRFESTWTMSRATKIGLTQKGTWQDYGPEMLKNRAKATVVRDGAIDVILGIKRIMNDLGLEFSEEVDDDIAVSNVLYTPEEMGAEVDGEERPIKGKVVNVTAPGVSETQDRMVRGAMKLIEGKDAEGIQKSVEATAAHPSLDADTKISRLDAVLKAVNEVGKGKDEVSHEEEASTLSAYLEHTIHAIKANR